MTVSPRSTSVPAAGFCEITSSSGSSDSRSSTATSSPASVSRFSAESRDSPVTSGTSTCSGPEETNSWTRSPRSTSSPAAGTVRIAMPFSTVSDDLRSTVAARSRLSSVWIATACGSPLTVGTLTVPGPPDTSSTTVEPSSALTPGSGSWSTTWSKAAWLRTRDSSTSKPARSSTARACSSGLPTTRGTSRLSFDVRPATAMAISTAASATTSRPRITHGQRRPSASSSRGGGGAGGSVGAATATGAKAAVSCGTVAVVPSCAPAACSAAAKSSAVCQRCAGSFASAAITTDSSAGLTSGRSCESGGGGSDRCLSAIETALSPSKGSRPLSIS